MGENNPLISVIIPVYNGERYLSEAIESVRAQTYSPFEIIVVDDGSTDSSANIAKSYHIVKYSFQSNSGLAAALNKGLSLASGDLISFLDADDIWTENKLELQVKVLMSDTSLDGVFGHHVRFVSKVANSITEQIKNDEGELLPGYFKGTALIKRESFFRVGLFDTKLNLGDFIDWYKRATDMDRKFRMLPELVLRRRIHDHNSSFLKRDAVKDYVKIMKASLDRQRSKDADNNDASH